MHRVALRLQIRPGLSDAYDRLHQAVWPELLHDLREAGVIEYSIFRNGLELFLFLRVQDLERFEASMQQSEANRRWQEMMLPFWDVSLGSNAPVRMPEVFYMPPIDDASSSR